VHGFYRPRRARLPLAMTRQTMWPSPSVHRVGARNSVFRGSIAGPPVPLSTLQPRDRPHRRMTRGQRGSLLLHRGVLSSPTPRRFIPALSDSHLTGFLNAIIVSRGTLIDVRRLVDYAIGRFSIPLAESRGCHRSPSPISVTDLRHRSPVTDLPSPIPLAESRGCHRSPVTDLLTDLRSPISRGCHRSPSRSPLSLRWWCRDGDRPCRRRAVPWPRPPELLAPRRREVRASA
jgi:hypothetical protein